MRENRAIYIEQEGCGQCVAAKPRFLEECERLHIPVTVREAEPGDASAMGEKRHLPFAIVTYEGKIIKGGAWSVWDVLKTL